MEKLNVRNNEISLENVINGTFYDINERKMLEIDEDTQYELGEKFRGFLLSKCRYNSGVYSKIKHTDILSGDNYGLYGRLVYNFENDTVDYVAGQNYPEEIAYLKKLILK